MTYITIYMKKLSSLNLFFWSILWLMLMVVVGTIEQKEIGLFQVQERYFSSIYFTIKGIPLPSGGFVLTIMGLGLLSQLIFKTNYKNFNKMGITITHMGALLLIVGAFITKFFAIEGSMIIPEGKILNYIQDYKNFEFILQDQALNKSFFKIGAEKIVLHQKYPLSINTQLVFVKNFSNCELKKRESALDQAVGFASIFDFNEISTTAESIRCIQFKIIQNKSESLYGIYQNMPKQQSVVLDMSTFIAEIQNKHLELPFSVKLLNFEKKFHQGTLISKSFKSEVEIIDGDIKTRHIIEMNAPLRYKGYTFYQSSFSENAEGEITELAVVKNTGQVFPYISSIIICLGILLHLLINSKKLFKTEHL